MNTFSTEICEWQQMAKSRCSWGDIFFNIKDSLHENAWVV